MNELFGMLLAIAQIGLSIVAIAASVWVFYKGKQRRSLSCKFSQIDRPIEIKAGNALQGDIQILYRGQSVQNIFVVQATIENTGNLPIRRSDIITPVTFCFGIDTELLREPHNINETPINLESKWELTSTGNNTELNTAVLLFDLLNPGWKIAAEFICTGNSQLPEISAKIVGVSEITSLDHKETGLIAKIKAMLLMGVLTIIMIGGPTLIFAKSLGEAITALLILGLGQLFPLVLFYFVLSRHRKRNPLKR